MLTDPADDNFEAPPSSVESPMLAAFLSNKNSASIPTHPHGAGNMSIPSTNEDVIDTILYAGIVTSNTVSATSAGGAAGGGARALRCHEGRPGGCRVPGAGCWW